MCFLNKVLSLAVPQPKNSVYSCIFISWKSLNSYTYVTRLVSASWIKISQKWHCPFRVRCSKFHHHFLNSILCSSIWICGLADPNQNFLYINHNNLHHSPIYINLLVHALAYNQWLLTMSLPSGILMAILPMIFIKRKIFRNTINCWWRAEHNSLDFIFYHDFQKVAGTRNIVGIVSFK